MKSKRDITVAAAMASTSAIVGGLLLTALASPTALGSTPEQLPPSALFLPDLQAGTGDTEVAVQNLGTSSTQVDLDLFAMDGSGVARLSRYARALRPVRFLTTAEPSLPPGTSTGRLTASGPLGANVTVRWPTGAAAAYEASVGAQRLIAPLVARDVLGHSTLLRARTAITDAIDYTLTMQLVDPANGEVRAESSSPLGPDEARSWDLAADFGPDTLGSNSVGGGWLGSAWFSAKLPVVALAYGAEDASLASAAYIARPLSAADPVQHLPIVRANYQGDSLLAIANAASEPVEVAIDYRGATFSPSGAGRLYTQTLSLAPRGSAFLDLSDLGRGTVASPGLPRGTGPEQGFIGSAILHATGPVLAVAQEATRREGQTATVAAYHAFAPADFGVGFAAPAVRHQADGVSTTLVLYNPGPGNVAAGVVIFGAGGDLVGSVDNPRVPPGSIVLVRVGAQSGLPAGEVGRLTVAATGAISALLYDASDPAPAGGAAADTSIARAVRTAGGTPSLPPTPPRATATAVGSVSPTATSSGSASRTATVTASATATPAPSDTPDGGDRAHLYLPWARGGP